MSQVRTDVDLAELARPRTKVPPPRRRWRRYWLPVLILLAFGLVLVSTLTDLLRPTIEVTVVRPARVTGEAGAAIASGSVAVQAAGWIEPDPFPVRVPALADGVVEEVLVQESDVVAAGDAVARLIDEDARIAHAAAGAELAARRAAHDEAEARRTIAEERMEAALEVTEAVAATKADLAGRRAAAERRRAAVRQGAARLALAAEELAVQRELEEAGASGPRQVEIAAARLEEERGLLAGLEAAAAEAEAAVPQAEAAHVRAVAEERLRFTDRLQVDVSRAAASRAAAEVQRATAALDEAALRLHRMTVTTPVAGVVLERLAVPGRVLSARSGDQAVCSLFDPARLRVRVDVPQTDVAKIFVGQRAEIDASSRSGRPYAGEVLRIVQRADIQKVTLQAHVRVADGDGLLRPEMLVQVRFLGGEGGGGAAATRPDAVLVPARLVQDGHVWVIDAARSTATRRAIETAGRRGDAVLVTGGLNLTDKLIDEGRGQLEEGARVRVRSSD